jgi:hypothetical protein
MASIDTLIAKIDELITTLNEGGGTRPSTGRRRTTTAAASPATPGATPDAAMLERMAEEAEELEATTNRIRDAAKEIREEIANMGLLERVREFEDFSRLKEKGLLLDEKRLETLKERYETLLEIARIEGDEAVINVYIALVENYSRELDEAKQKTKEFVKNAKEIKPALEMGADAGNKLASSIGLGNNEFTSFFNKVNNFKGGIGKLMLGMGAGFTASILNPTQLASAVIKSSFDLMTTANQMFADTKKGYGVEYGSKLNSVFTKTERSLRRYGISAEEANKIGGTLNDTFSDFLDMNEDQQKELVKNAGIMQKLGIENSEYSESIRFMEYSMGENREAAQENIAELVEFGRKNGIQAKQTIANFTKVRSYISQFGDNWQKTFNRMSAISRKTGMDIQDLVSISQGFDTFDSAATSVGQLNALLGGPFLNTVEMIRTEDPAEQIMKIKQAFDSAGKSVNSMSKFELKGFAESIPGINGDIEKMRTLLNKLDSGMISSADAITEALEGPTKEQEGMEKQLLASQSIAESLQVIAKSIAIFTPLLESLNPVFNGLATAISNMGEAFPQVVLGISKFFSYLGKGLSSTAKGLPIIGGILSLITAVYRLYKGDIVGAVLEGGAAVAGFAGFGGIAQLGMLAYDASGVSETLNINRFRSGTQQSGVDDFIYRGNGVNGSITPINSKDQFLGLKDGGPAQAGLKDIMDGMSRDKVSYETSNSIQNKTENDFARTNINNTNANNATPNINLTVMLEGRELRAFVKQVIADNLNPLK